MDLVEDIGTHIADNTSLSKGVDLWLNSIENEREGVVLKYVRTINNHGNVTTSNYNIFVLYKDWTTQKDLLNTLTNLFSNKRGTISFPWATSGEITTEGFGVDEFDRNIGVITINIKH